MAIARLATKQNGNVTRAQLLDLGLNKHDIGYRVKVGRLYRVSRGVYAVGRRPVTAQEWASAAVLACGSGAALSHGSAMALWGYWRHWDKPYEVTVVGDRRTNGIRVHRSTTLRRRDVTTQLGIRVTTPAQTALDMSPRLNDKALKRTVNNMLHSLWSSKGEFEETLARHPSAPGAKRIARLIGLPGTPTRSGWEDEFPVFCERYGLPTPVMGAPIGGYIVDALFVAERVIVELDRWPFHGDKIGFETDRERDAFMLTRRLVTVRITEERLDGRPGEEAERLHVILAHRRAAHAPSAA
jgi:Transcriptional regulator, AbiEi antitoxin